MVDLKQTKDRFKELEWASQLRQCTLGGLGGINSWTALYLARIGHSILGYDMDTVDSVNIGGQHYGISNIGNIKSRATHDLLYEFCGELDFVPLYEFGKDSEVTPYCFSGFDNMAARKLMFEKWKQLDNEDKIFIDGRLLAEAGQVYFVTKGREAQYEATLFSDDLAEPVSCTGKATTHCGALIGSLIVSGFNNHLCNVVNRAMVRPLPFNYNFQLSTFSFEIPEEIKTEVECKDTPEEIQVQP